MISQRTITGATILEYRFADLNRHVELLSLYEGKSLKTQSGAGSFNDIPIIKDDFELIIPFYKEFHSALFPVLSRLLLMTDTDKFATTPSSPSLPNIEWNIKDEPKWEDEDVPETKKSLQTNLFTILDNQIESGYKYYALFRWFATINVMPQLAEKYSSLYRSTMADIKSTTLHNNIASTRVRLPYNTL